MKVNVMVQRKCALLILLWLPVLSLGDNTVSHEPVRVLMVSSWHQGFPWESEVKQGFTERIKDATQNIDVYYEFLDAGRFPQQTHRQAFLLYLEEKYQSSAIDFLIAESLPAAVAIDQAQDLLPGTKRIFVTSGGQDQLFSSNHTAISIQADFAASIKEMLRIMDASKIYVVTDTFTAGGSERLKEFRSAFDAIDTTATLEVLENLPLDKLLSTVAHLPKNSAVYDLLIFQDGEHKTVNNFEVTKQLSVASNVPIFSNWSILIDYGIVGGYMISGVEVGHGAADLALNSTGDIVDGRADMNRGYNYVYNHRQLKRWGIDPALIPSEAVIKFQPSSIYRQYKTELLIMALVFLLLTGALISSVWISHQRKAYNKELASKANQDPLTGIFNRRHFMALATQTVGKSNRREMNACMLMLDLDYFKEVNDKLGHDAGDRVLTELARLFSSTLRADDIFARFGGEEFIFLLPNTTLDQGKIVAEKLRYNAEKYAGPDGIQVTVSIGIAILNSDIELAIKQADIALYNAKEKGRNRVDMYC